MDFQLFLSIAFAGVVGTTVMILVMGIIHGLKWAEADMIRAVGSIYTQKMDSAFRVGLVINYAAGILFAFCYSCILAFAPLPTDSPKIVFFLCLMISTVHGLVVSLLLAVVVAEHHPMEKFRKAGGGVIVSHLIGHIFYGTFVGLVFAFGRLQFTFFS